jgi:transmembrane sensor
MGSRVVNDNTNPDPGARPRAAGGRRLHPAEWVLAAGAVEDVLGEMQARLRQRRRRRLSAALGVAASLALAALWIVPPRGAHSAAHAAGSAVVMRPERQHLSDGSIIELRPGAEIAVDYSAHQRLVSLVQGEAHFQVAKNARPFVVRTPRVEVRAVGTAFSVQLGARQVEVLVTGGVVSVESTKGVSDAAAAGVPDAVPDPAVLAVVAAGNRVVVPIERAASPVAEVAPIASADLARRLAWRAVQLEFSRTPVEEALRILHAHTPAEHQVRIRLANPAIGRIELSGTLRADNLEMLLLLLEHEHGIRSERLSDREVLLR